jgi:putative membrane protein
MPDIPYCGAPPVPGGVAWNLDPVLMAALLGLGGWLAWRARRNGRGGGAAPPALALGWAILALALVSPLCSLSVALFEARVAQHLVLTLVAAPLLALGLGRPRGGAAAPRLGRATLVFGLVLWAWHLPGPYGATFRSDALYWAMQASLTGAAFWLWRALLVRALDRPDAAALAGLVTAVQMGALGALLTLAPRPLFAEHAGTTAAWGLTPLEDQQLGGLLMWVPGGLLFAATMVLALGLALRGPGGTRRGGVPAPGVAE